MIGGGLRLSQLAARFKVIKPIAMMRYSSYSWQQPSGRDSSVVLYNSLTKQKDRLLFANGNDQLTWYSCGPTVYDHSHIGHARCYLQQDIVLRILQSFHIDVQYVMGITDIDDKIINKARELPKLKNSVSPIQQVAVPFENSFWEARTLLVYANLLTCP